MHFKIVSCDLSKLDSMDKEKFSIEYPINSSKGVLYNCFSTPSGLAEWFCDDVNIKKEVVHPHLIPLEDWLKLKNQGGRKELLAYRQSMWASEAGPKMVQNGDKMFVRILGLSPMDPLMRKPILAREEKIVDTAEGKQQGVEKEVCRDFHVDFTF